MFNVRLFSPPPLTCAGRVLQAAPLLKRGKRLAFDPGATGCGPGGHVGGHDPGSCCSARLEWEEEEEENWMSQAELWRTEWCWASEERRQREEEEEDRRERERDVAQMLSAWASLTAVDVWEGVSRLTGPSASASLCRETNSAPSQKTPVPELQRWWWWWLGVGVGGWCTVSYFPPWSCAKNTHLHSHAQQPLQHTHSRALFYCCHDNHKSVHTL